MGPRQRCDGFENFEKYVCFLSETADVRISILKYLTCSCHTLMYLNKQSLTKLSHRNLHRPFFVSSVAAPFQPRFHPPKPWGGATKWPVAMLPAI